MNRRTLSVCLQVLCLAALWAIPAAADPPADGRLGERISLDLRNAAVGEVFGSFAMILDAELSLDARVAGDVDLTLKGVRVATAMTALCDSLECTWTLDAGPPRRLVVSPAGEPAGPRSAGGSWLDERISVSLAAAKAAAVFTGMTEVAGGIDLDLDPAVEGAVTLEVHEAPAAEILDRVCAQVGCRWEVVSAPRPALRVRPARSNS